MLGVKETKCNKKPARKAEQSLKPIGKSRVNPVKPSDNSVSICSHRDVIIIEEMPRYQFVCDRCGKGFTHNENLLRHKMEHDAPTNSLDQPKPPASNQPREKP